MLFFLIVALLHIGAFLLIRKYVRGRQNLYEKRREYIAKGEAWREKYFSLCNSVFSKEQWNELLDEAGALDTEEEELFQSPRWRVPFATATRNKLESTP